MLDLPVDEFYVDTNTLAILLCGIFDESMDSNTLSKISARPEEFLALRSAVRSAPRGITITPHVLTETFSLLENRLGKSEMERFTEAIKQWLTTTNEFFDSKIIGKDRIILHEKSAKFGVVDIALFLTQQQGHKSTAIITTDAALHNLCKYNNLNSISMPELVAKYL